jgi:6-phosphogluconolactonase
MHKWFVYKEFDKAAKMAADYLAESIETCIKEKGICHVILPGGNTPVTSLELLSEKSLSWDKVHWYLGDERCYPQGHSERNDLMLDNHLWSRILPTHIHRIPAELGAEIAAELYREEIKSVDTFDIAFLGMGEDGHTASLFPHNNALEDNRSVVPVYHSPKPPGDRVSLSINTLRNTKNKVVLVGGDAKTPVITKIKADEGLPINCIGDIHWFIDEAANTTV